MQPDLAGFDYILERQLKPEARKDIIAMFQELKLRPTAMIDVSDGLASEAMHIARRSELGVKIYDEKIPIDPVTYRTARDFNLDPTTCALNGGEDYELLFTIAQSDFDKVKRITALLRGGPYDGPSEWLPIGGQARRATRAESARLGCAAEK